MSESYGYEVPYSQFLEEVLPFVPDVPEFVAENAVRNAIIEFCKKTRWWQVDATPVTGIVGVSNYIIETPPDTEFFDIVQAWYDNVLLIPKSFDELADIYRLLDFRALNGRPVYITRVMLPEIQLVPTPILTEPNALTLRIALSPRRDSTGCDSSIYEHWLEEIATGARARLYSTPGQPYSSQPMAQEYTRRWKLALAQARNKVDKGLGRASNRIEFQGWV